MLALSCIFAGFAFSSESDTNGKRYAILIGINQYADASIVQLSAPRNDVADLGKVLVDSHWDRVFVLSDDLEYRNQNFPGRTNIEDKISLLAELAKPEDTVFIFFSGHGISDGKGSSIMPVDASLNRLGDTSIPVATLVKPFNDRGLRKVVLAIDACREQVATVKGVSVVGISGGAGESAASAIFYATKQGWYSYEDKNGRNGVFTRFMLLGLSGDADGYGPSGLSDGFVTFTELAAWLPDATASYALDQGMRQQAVAVSGSGDISALDVPVSITTTMSMTSAKKSAVPAAMAVHEAIPSAPTTVPSAATGSAATFASGSEIHSLISSIKGHVNQAVADSLRDINSTISFETEKKKETAKPAKKIEAKRETKKEEPMPAKKTEDTDSKDTDSEDSGFSVVQLGFVNPLQLFPKEFTIVGPAVGIIQTRNSRVFGIQVAPIALTSAMGGIQTGVICSSDTLGGLQAGVVVNHADTVYGAQIGLINTADKVYGLQCGLINVARSLYGVQIGLINTLEKRGLFGKFMFGLNVGF